jgi:hypothetical protein
MAVEHRPAEGAARVRANPPPPALMQKINPLVRRLLRSPTFGPRLRALTLLEFSGHRSGRLLSVPVALHTIDGAPMAFTARPWRLNFAGGAPVTLTHRGRVLHGEGTLLAHDPDELGLALRMAMDNGATPFLLGLKVDRGHQPTIADLARTGLCRIRFQIDQT